MGRKNNSRVEMVVDTLLYEIASASNQDFYGEITMNLRIAQGVIQSVSIHRERRISVALAKNSNNETE